MDVQTFSYKVVDQSTMKNGKKSKSKFENTIENWLNKL